MDSPGHSVKSRTAGLRAPRIELPGPASTQWSALRRAAQLRLLKMHYDSGVGHIGGNLSCLDVLLYLHHYVMGPDDQFVLSKGHGAGALYITLWTLGRLSDADLATFHKDDTRLCGHPPANGIEDILFATGSLGHGVSLAAGLALAKRIKGNPGHVYCVTSDGEWNEGSCWEALIFARHQQLGNLTTVVDLNGFQGFGSTRDVADMGSLAAKFRAFDAGGSEIDGHEEASLRTGLLRPSNPSLRQHGPRMVVAHTRKGCGVSFMEDRMEWHYLPMNKLQYKIAVDEVEARHEGDEPAREAA